MKKILQASIVILGIYIMFHILFGLDYNSTMSLITRITKWLFTGCLLLYIIKFVETKK